MMDRLKIPGDHQVLFAQHFCGYSKVNDQSLGEEANNDQNKILMGSFSSPVSDPERYPSIKKEGTQIFSISDTSQWTKVAIISPFHRMTQPCSPSASILGTM